MKKIIKYLMVFSLLSIVFVACEKENEEEELDIAFKTGSEYTSADVTLASGSTGKIGIEAETEKKKDPIIKFNISESINGGSSSTVYSQDLEDTEFEYDYAYMLEDTVSGNTHKYTFTVTNRDGINKQKSLTITVQ